MSFYNTNIVLWISKNDRWYISKFLHGNRVRVAVVDDKEGYSEYPILHDNSSIPVYDNPERIPKYVKNKVTQIMNNMRKAGTLGEVIEEG